MSARPLTVGLITTWDSKCGVSEYSRDLAAALGRSGCHVVILGSYVVNPVAWEEAGPPVRRFFNTGWHDSRGVDLDKALRAIESRGVDVLHLQYQSFIYAPPFLDCLERLAEAAPLVATFHDPCIPPEFPMKCLKGAIVHSATLKSIISGIDSTVIAPGCHVIADRARAKMRKDLGFPSGPVVSSFGLGRVAHEEVLEALGGLVADYPGLTYALAAPAERAPSVQAAAVSCGMQGRVRYMGDFLPPHSLFDLLQAADVIALYYPEFGVRGVSSAAARIAIASRRPVILTDVYLFEDLPASLKIRYGDAASLRSRIRTLIEKPQEASAALSIQETLVRENTWDRVAGMHLQVYRGALGRS